ncbi:MAG: CRISPR-associated endoribonuclease Cas6, partial [Prevotellaceae bacterium]|nr:CRISPR-associated endoribonuclease Cas6 [Prevotellaceae bacterium]
ADENYALFLHEEGYKKPDSKKTFKLFTFSDLSTPFGVKGDRMILKTRHAQLTLCFHVPEAATNFIRGVFLHQRIELADKKSKAAFIIQQVEVLPFWKVPVQPDQTKETILKPTSPMVTGIINEKGNYCFLAPNDACFIPTLLHHWKEKYAVVYGKDEAEHDFADIELTVLNADRAKSRLITIKADTPQQTRIRGFVGFLLKVKTKVRVLELALNAGIAIYGSVGMGSVEVVEN